MNDGGAGGLKEEPIGDPQLLARIEGFEDALSLDEWATLAGLAGKDSNKPYLRLLTVPPGKTFIARGEWDMHVFITLGGVAEALVIDETGAPRVAKRYHPYECVGELAVLEEAPRSADVRASKEGPATLLKIDWSLTGQLDRSELVLRFVKLIMKKVVGNTRASHEAIGRVIEKAHKIMRLHDTAIAGLREENSRLREEFARREAVIQHMRRTLENQGVDYYVRDSDVTGAEKPPAGIGIGAAIDLLQDALDQIKSG